MSCKLELRRNFYFFYLLLLQI